MSCLVFPSCYVQMRLVVFFRMRLEMGACHAKASCRSCTRVMYASCRVFPNAS